MRRGSNWTRRGKPSSEPLPRFGAAFHCKSEKTRLSARARFAVPAMLAAMLTLPAVAPARADRSNARSGCNRSRAIGSEPVRCRTPSAGRGDPVAARPQSSPSAPRFGFAHPFGFGSALVGSAPVGQGPSTLAVDPATHTIYVANGTTTTARSPRRGHGLGDRRAPLQRAATSRAARGRGRRSRSGTCRAGSRSTSAPTPCTSATSATTPCRCSTARPATPRTPQAAGRRPRRCPSDWTRSASSPTRPTTPCTSRLRRAAVGGAGDSTTVSMIDSATCNATDLAACPTTPPPTVDVGASPDDVDVDQATHTVYVTTLDRRRVNSGWTVFDANTCNATVQIGMRSDRHPARRSNRSERRRGRPGERHALHRQLRQHDLGLRPARLQRRRSLRLRDRHARDGHPVRRTTASSTTLRGRRRRRCTPSTSSIRRTTPLLVVDTNVCNGRRPGGVRDARPAGDPHRVRTPNRSSSTRSPRRCTPPTGRQRHLGDRCDAHATRRRPSAAGARVPEAPIGPGRA